MTKGIQNTQSDVIPPRNTNRGTLQVLSVFNLQTLDIKINKPRAIISTYHTKLLPELQRQQNRGRSTCPYGLFVTLSYHFPEAYIIR